MRDGVRTKVLCQGGISGESTSVYRRWGLECELHASLNLVEVLVVGQEVFLEVVPSLVEHYLSILVERVVNTYSGRIDVATTN